MLNTNFKVNNVSKYSKFSSGSFLSQRFPKAQNENILRCKPLQQGDVEVKSDKQMKVGCVCSPTTHPGSFRCRLHRATRNSPSAGTAAYNSTSVQPAAPPACANAGKFEQDDNLSKEQKLLNEISLCRRNYAKIVLRRNNEGPAKASMHEGPLPSRLKPSLPNSSHYLNISSL